MGLPFALSAILEGAHPNLEEWLIISLNVCFLRVLLLLRVCSSKERCNFILSGFETEVPHKQGLAGRILLLR